MQSALKLSLQIFNVLKPQITCTFCTNSNKKNAKHIQSQENVQIQKEKVPNISSRKCTNSKKKKSPQSLLKCKLIKKNQVFFLTRSLLVHSLVFFCSLFQKPQVPSPSHQGKSEVCMLRPTQCWNPEVNWLGKEECAGPAC